MMSNMNKSDIVYPKRTFLTFMAANWALWLLTTYVFWYIGNPGLYAVHEKLPLVVGVFFIIFHSLVIVGFFLIIRTIIFEREILASQRLRKMVLKICLPMTISAPLTLLARKFFSLTKEELQQSFIELNNYLISVKPFGLHPDKLMILLPQCMQNNNCRVRISGDISACRHCGNCQVGSIIDICNQYEVKAFIVTGGTLARRIIKQKRPQAVVAVACERELVDGIGDCYPLPVYAILNLRPHGPCVNTSATLDKLEKTIKHFVTHKKTGNPKQRLIRLIKRQAA